MVRGSTMRVYGNTPRVLDLHQEKGQVGGASPASCIYWSDVSGTAAERAARTSSALAVAAVSEARCAHNSWCEGWRSAPRRPPTP